MQLHFCEGSEIIAVLIFSSPVDAVVPDTFPPLHFISMGHRSSLLVSGTNDGKRRQLTHWWQRSEILAYDVVSKRWVLSVEDLGLLPCILNAAPSL